MGGGLLRDSSTRPLLPEAQCEPWSVCRSGELQKSVTCSGCRSAGPSVLQLSSLFVRRRETCRYLEKPIDPPWHLAFICAILRWSQQNICSAANYQMLTCSTHWHSPRIIRTSPHFSLSKDAASLSLSRRNCISSYTIPYGSGLCFYRLPASMMASDLGRFTSTHGEYA